MGQSHGPLTTATIDVTFRGGGTGDGCRRSPLCQPLQDRTHRKCLRLKSMTAATTGRMSVPVGWLTNGVKQFNGVMARRLAPVPLSLPFTRTPRTPGRMQSGSRGQRYKERSHESRLWLACGLQLRRPCTSGAGPLHDQTRCRIAVQ
jgi:hypothetical protein